MTRTHSLSVRVLLALVSLLLTTESNFSALFAQEKGSVRSRDPSAIRPTDAEKNSVIRKVFVPEDLLREFTRGGYLTMDKTDFESSLQREKDKKVLRDRTISVDRAIFFGEFFDARTIRGNGTFSVVGHIEKSNRLNLGQINFGIKANAWKNDPETIPNLGNDLGGNLILDVAKDDVLEFSWNLSRSTKSANGTEFEFHLPLSSLTEMYLELPKGYSLESQSAMVRPLTKREKRNIAANSKATTPNENGWIILPAKGNRIQFQLVRSLGTGVIREPLNYSTDAAHIFRSDGIESKVVFRIGASASSSDLNFLIPKNHLCTGIEMDGQSVSFIKSASESTAVQIEPTLPIQNGSEIQLNLFRRFSYNGKIEIPAISIADSKWLYGRTKIMLQNDQRLERFEAGANQIVYPSTPGAIELEMADNKNPIQLELAQDRKNWQSQSLCLLTPNQNGLLVTQYLYVKPKYQDVFEVSLFARRIWNIDSIEIVDSGPNSEGNTISDWVQRGNRIDATFSRGFKANSGNIIKITAFRPLPRNAVEFQLGKLVPVELSPSTVNQNGSFLQILDSNSIQTNISQGELLSDPQDGPSVELDLAANAVMDEPVVHIQRGNDVRLKFERTLRRVSEAVVWQVAMRNDSRLQSRVEIDCNSNGPIETLTFRNFEPKNYVWKVYSKQILQDKGPIRILGRTIKFDTPLKRGEVLVGINSNSIQSPLEINSIEIVNADNVRNYAVIDRTLEGVTKGQTYIVPTTESTIRRFNGANKIVELVEDSSLAIRIRRTTENTGGVVIRNLSHMVYVRRQDRRIRTVVEFDAIFDSVFSVKIPTSLKVLRVAAQAKNPITSEMRSANDTIQIDVKKGLSQKVTIDCLDLTPNNLGSQPGDTAFPTIDSVMLSTVYVSLPKGFRPDSTDAKKLVGAIKLQTQRLFADLQAEETAGPTEEIENPIEELTTFFPFAAATNNQPLSTIVDSDLETIWQHEQWIDQLPPKMTGMVEQFKLDLKKYLLSLFAGLLVICLRTRLAIFAYLSGIVLIAASFFLQSYSMVHISSWVGIGLLGGSLIQFFILNKDPVNERFVPESDAVDEETSRISPAAKVTILLFGIGILAVQGTFFAGESFAQDKSKPAPKYQDVIYPIDEDNKPIGNEVYVPRELYKKLIGISDSKENDSVSLIKATYSCRFETENARSAPIIRAKFELDSRNSDSKFILPLDTKRLRYINDTARLNNATRGFGFSKSEKGWEVSLADPGAQTLSMEFKPAVVDQFDERTVTFEIPKVAQTQFFISSPQNLNPIRVFGDGKVARTLNQLGVISSNLPSTKELKFAWPIKSSENNKVICDLFTLFSASDRNPYFDIFLSQRTESRAPIRVVVESGYGFSPSESDQTISDRPVENGIEFTIAAPFERLIRLRFRCNQGQRIGHFQLPKLIPDNFEISRSVLLFDDLEESRVSFPAEITTRSLQVLDLERYSALVLSDEESSIQFGFENTQFQTGTFFHVSAKQDQTKIENALAEFEYSNSNLKCEYILKLQGITESIQLRTLANNRILRIIDLTSGSLQPFIQTESGEILIPREQGIGELELKIDSVLNVKASVERGEFTLPFLNFRELKTSYAVQLNHSNAFNISPIPPLLLPLMRVDSVGETFVKSWRQNVEHGATAKFSISKRDAPNIQSSLHLCELTPDGSQISARFYSDNFQPLALKRSNIVEFEYDARLGKNLQVNVEGSTYVKETRSGNYVQFIPNREMECEYLEFRFDASMDVSRVNRIKNANFDIELDQRCFALGSPPEQKVWNVSGLKLWDKFPLDLPSFQLYRAATSEPTAVLTAFKSIAKTHQLLLSHFEYQTINSQRFSVTANFLFEFSSSNNPVKFAFPEGCQVLQAKINGRSTKFDYSEGGIELPTSESFAPVHIQLQFIAIAKESDQDSTIPIPHTVDSQSGPRLVVLTSKSLDQLSNVRAGKGVSEIQKSVFLANYVRSILATKKSTESLEFMPLATRNWTENLNQWLDELTKGLEEGDLDPKEIAEISAIGNLISNSRDAKSQDAKNQDAKSDSKIREPLVTHQYLGEQQQGSRFFIVNEIDGKLVVEKSLEPNTPQRLSNFSLVFVIAIGFLSLIPPLRKWLFQNRFLMLILVLSIFGIYWVSFLQPSAIGWIALIVAFCITILRVTPKSILYRFYSRWLFQYDD